ncbi:MarR family winged helix-turn-helix transcriptional regulator [Microlunatus sp. Gsoil 973]|uniref:MarR family winged helix-turn-helix transcriptional regulator n=1 Tax=Microlunatus sp. Gsoil 973 TaxID=2672569 RepID=UPI0012B456A9|nr:MarR family winged helix-turn-helix transcriptional regulator [Microlunatus sp. Gsoil 973]QGN35210.1 MarR family transcriptional regulator [Microlunatus sp. Gsoil 973]
MTGDDQRPTVDPGADSVDRVMASWARTRPDLDVTPIGIFTRLDRLKRAIDREMIFEQFGLNGADFAVLATLVRVAPDNGMSQRGLMAELDLSSGTVSLRVERLVRAGLVTRTADPDDGRGSIVALTSAGRDVFERCAPAHLDNERRLLTALTPEQQDQLAALLRHWLSVLETSSP